MAKLKIIDKTKFIYDVNISFGKVRLTTDFEEANSDLVLDFKTDGICVSQEELLQLKIVVDHWFKKYHKVTKVA